ncbi:hypothetical protein [Megasphaera sp.]|uniref:hypothetical protein n=1 Tax=Megasphaera sp. TaxID=2023260 RepID=UPI00307AF861
MLRDVLKSKISDIDILNITGTISEIEEIINITKQVDIKRKTKWLIYIAIAILSLPFIIMGFVTATISIAFVVLLNVINFIILIIPGYAFMTIGKLLKREHENTERLY